MSTQTIERPTSHEAARAVRDAATMPLTELRHIAIIAIGEHVRQGDLYIVRIEACSDWKPSKNKQLAPGETQGSRHMLDGPAVMLENPNGAQVRTNRRTGAFSCPGPQIQARGRFTVTHPEHADFSLPAGSYQVYFQVDGQSQRRVLD